VCICVCVCVCGGGGGGRRAVVAQLMQPRQAGRVQRHAPRLSTAQQHPSLQRWRPNPQPTLDENDVVRHPPLCNFALQEAQDILAGGALQRGAMRQRTTQQPSAGRRVAAGEPVAHAGCACERERAQAGGRTWPSRGTTTSSGRSVHLGSGIAITAASAQADARQQGREAMTAARGRACRQSRPAGKASAGACPALWRK
jgi:hypothetical protein